VALLCILDTRLQPVVKDQNVTQIALSELPEVLMAYVDERALNILHTPINASLCMYVQRI
jgi:hypothetical protein